MNRKEFVNQVFKTLEENHIYLYHDVSKEEFEKRKSLFLENVDNLDETNFEGGILKLFALFRDAHTVYDGVNFSYVDADIKLVGKEFYIKNNGIFKKIEKINGFKIENVVEKLKELIAYEVETWAYFKIASQLIYCPKAMKMIDCGSSDNEIIFSYENNEKTIAKISNADNRKQRTKRKPTYTKSKFIDNRVLYIRYRACENIENYPFDEFIKDISNEWKTLPEACLIDIRNNEGGNSSVLNPLTKWLKENKIRSYVLMNGGVFSSGIFALADFKFYLNATLIGTEAGQPTANYGECCHKEIDGKRFSYCKKYFKFTSCQIENERVKANGILNAFNYVGVIRPDIRIEEKIEDLNNGVDTQLEEALRIIEKDIKKKRSDDD